MYLSVSKSTQLPKPRPIPHHREDYQFVNAVAPPPVKPKPHVPTYKYYKNIESIVDTKRVRMPEDEPIVILGSGPKGREKWPLIPKGAEVWALNEGVNACIDHPKECAFKISKWFVNDPHVLETMYWAKANKNYHGVRIFGDSTVKLIRRRFLYVRAQIDAVREGRIFIIPRGLFHKKDQGHWSHDPNIFKPGGTVCAAALWVAQIKGPVKRVYLCGIDMSMDTHYSNPQQPDHPDPRHGEEWGTSRPALDSRIRHYKSLGMEIYTLSETKLRDVEMRDVVE